MSVIAENAFVDDLSRESTAGRVFVQVEINRICHQFERTACGENCFLVAREVPPALPMPESTIFQIIDEILEVGDLVGDFAIPAMEPMDTPERLFRVLGQLDEAPTEKQPVTRGIITSGMRLPRHTDEFTRSPLTWVIVSADLGPTGLRPVGVWDKAIRNTCALRQSGGCEHVCVNTVARGQVDALCEVGLRAQEMGVEQWYLAPFRMPANGRMLPEQGPKEMLELANSLAEVFKDQMTVLVEVDFKTFSQALGTDSSLTDQDDHWRLELPLSGSSVRLMTLNPDARIVRVRWDGALLSKGDIYRKGLATGSFGHYSPGRLADVIRNLAEVPASIGK